MRVRFKGLGVSGRDGLERCAVLQQWTEKECFGVKERYILDMMSMCLV